MTEKHSGTDAADIDSGRVLDFEGYEKEQGEDGLLPGRSRGGKFLLAVLFLVVGVALGVAAKTLAEKRITLGYWDFTIQARDRESLDLNALEKRLVVRREEEQKRQEEALKNAVPGDLPPLPPIPELPDGSPDGPAE